MRYGPMNPSFSIQDFDCDGILGPSDVRRVVLRLTNYRGRGFGGGEGGWVKGTLRHWSGEVSHALSGRGRGRRENEEEEEVEEEEEEEEEKTKWRLYSYNTRYLMQ